MDDFAWPNKGKVIDVSVSLTEDCSDGWAMNAFGTPDDEKKVYDLLFIKMRQFNGGLWSSMPGDCII